MDMNFAVFQEPRGVMRILHFVFSICAFATTSGYVNEFVLDHKLLQSTTTSGVACNATATIVGNFASDAKFFVATGVLAMLYSLVIIVVYVKFDEMYRSNNQIPLLDFIFTVFFGILWLSSSAAWANGLTGLKHVTDPSNVDWVPLSQGCEKCPVTVHSFSTLNISVIFGFLNFFLWAADLWFLYKETVWFQNAQTTSSGV